MNFAVVFNAHICTASNKICIKTTAANCCGGRFSQKKTAPSILKKIKLHLQISEPSIYDIKDYNNLIRNKNKII